MPSLPALLALAVLAATGPAVAASAAPAESPSPVANADTAAPCPADAPCAAAAAAAGADSDEAETADGEAEPDDDDDTAEPSSNAEAESQVVDPAASTDPTLRYSRDLGDAELARLWEKEIEKLGSISVGFADAGRMVNAVPFPKGDHWTIVSPPHTYGVQETVDQLVLALTEVATKFPGTRPVRVNHISQKDGGWLRPHRSHQSGRDVDLAFYYRDDLPPGGRGHRDHLIDLPRNWWLIRTLATRTDAQVVLVDRRIQKVLSEYALSIGEDKAFVDSIFRAGAKSLVQHARRHRDHFHIRFFAPRAQELGRRVQPLLAKRPEHNIVAHRIRRGDNLGSIARRYGSTISLIMRANGMRKSFIRAGRILQVPLRGPCNKCPMPPPVVVPPRRVAPEPFTVAPAPAAPAGPLEAAAAPAPVQATDAAAEPPPPPVPVGAAVP